MDLSVLLPFFLVFLNTLAARLKASAEQDVTETEKDRAILRQLNDLRAQVILLQERLDEKDFELKKLSKLDPAAFAELKEKAETQAEQIRKMEAKIEDLTTLATAKTTENERLLSEISGLRKENERLRIENDAFRSVLSVRVAAAETPSIEPNT